MIGIQGAESLVIFLITMYLTRLCFNLLSLNVGSVGSVVVDVRWISSSNRFCYSSDMVHFLCVPPHFLLGWRPPWYSHICTYDV